MVLIGSSARASATFTFAPDADSYVKSDTPTQNFGSSTGLRVDASPTTTSYLRFTVSGTSGAVTNATLRVFATSAQSVGYDVYKVLGTPPTFTESGLIYNNAPGLATTKTGSSGPVTASSWTSVDVTSLVTGNATYEFALTTTSSTALALSSREAGANAPQLVVTTSGTVSPPTNTGLPVVSGILQVGQALTTTNGTWTGSPTSFAYQWRRCTNSTDVGTCANIGGATGQSYTLTSLDLGKFIRVDVTATNAGGPSAAATSDATAVVQAASSDPFIMAAGDIACGATSAGASCQQVATSDLIVNANPAPAAVLPLGDVQYECGESADFTQFYEPSWGRKKSISKPVVGNHEYITTGTTTTCRNPPAPSGAAGYFGYFGAAASPNDQPCAASCQGYYSYDIGSNWHLIALNSNCVVVSCAAGQPQESWLAADLAANTKPCTLAYFHHPRYTSGGQSDTTALQPLWADLYAHRVDLVLVGHDHEYERFARLGAVPTFDSGGVEQPVVDPNGMRQIVAGTGGRNHTTFAGNFKSGSQVHDASNFGVIKVTLHAASYDWQFLPIAGGTGFTDAGTTPCRVASGTPVDPTAPNVPTGLSTSSPSTSQIDLTWSATTDNGGGVVGGYDVFRDGLKVGTTSATSYSDTGLLSGSTHTYTVDAFDAAGNTSAQSSPVQGTTQGATGTTFTAVADSYINSAAPTTNYGTAATIRVDASPTQKSYLKFTLTGLSGSVTSATLRVFANGTHSAGYNVFSVADSSWIESGTGGINFNNAPPPAGTSAGSSGPVTSGTWTSVNVTSLVTGNGTVSFALATTSSTALSMSSRQGANAPQLVVSTSAGGGPPPAPSLTLTESDPTDFVNGSTVYYRQGASGSFTVTATSSTATSVQFPVVFGSDGPNDSTPPFQQAYSWTSGASASGAKSVTASNGSGTSPPSTFTVTPDSTAPSTTSQCNGSACSGSFSSSSPVTVALVRSDAGSGIQASYYTTDGSTPTTSSTVYSAPFAISAVGTTVVKFFTVDNVGNQDSIQTLNVTITGGGGGIAFVQQAVAFGTTASLQAALPATGAGHALVAVIALAAGSSASVSSVTDSSAGAWSPGPVGFLTGVNSRVEIWYRLNAPSVTSVTVTLSAAKSAAVNVSEWSGVATTSAANGSSGGSGASSTTVSTPSLATTNATDVVIGAVNYPATATSSPPSGSFTSLNDFNSGSGVHGRAAYRITSATGSFQTSWTLSALSGGNGGAILALKAA